ncbi:hypothetical protein PQX77_017944 [Marasmius sp. AFHP31]|nr:hypothetical protein PQX77_017944 [Marasmius sp. AFHP31]
MPAGEWDPPDLKAILPETSKRDRRPPRRADADPVTPANRSKNAEPDITEISDSDKDIQNPPAKQQRMAINSEHEDNIGAVTPETAPCPGGVEQDVPVHTLSSTIVISPSVTMVIPIPEKRKSPTADNNYFFTPIQDGGSDAKIVKQTYNVCSERIVNHSTTLRQHMETKHKSTYIEWCKKNNFTPMLLS